MRSFLRGRKRRKSRGRKFRMVMRIGKRRTTAQGNRLGYIASCTEAVMRT